MPVAESTDAGVPPEMPPLQTLPDRVYLGSRCHQSGTPAKFDRARQGKHVSD
jgi:hypothetical protein